MFQKDSLTSTPNNWSSYRRKQVNIEKAKFNPTINRLIIIHYKHLHSFLVKKEGDEDIFNDTYLKLTHSYNPKEDFIEQYKHTFYNLKLAYKKDDSVANYYLSLIGDSISTIIEPYEILEEEEEKPKESKINNLKIELYALSKKANKVKNNKS